MMSNLGRHAPRNLAQELARAYDGEVPPPYYWRSAEAPAHVGARHHPGEIEVALPYAALPLEFALASVVSIEELDAAVERQARREEHD